METTVVNVGFALATLAALGYGWVLLQRDLRRKAESGGGKVSARIEDGWLIAASPGAMASRCELRRVTTVAVSVSVGSRGVVRRVNFRAEGRCNCSVPLDAPGMREVMAEVAGWPGFDRAAWQRAVVEKKAGRYGVWRGRLVVNAAIEAGGSRGDFAAGLLRKDDTISWDITYDALRATPGVAMVLNEFDREEYRVAGPLWLGPLRLQSLRVYMPVSIGGSELPRTDVPIPEWNASVVVTEAWGENYLLLKRCFDELFGPPVAAAGYEREDQANRMWRLGELTLTINYSYNSKHSNDMGYCSLAVRNGRRYVAYLVDGYTIAMRLEDVAWRQLSPVPLAVSRNYRRSEWVRSTPEALRGQAAGGWVVWNDAGAGMLGFASGEDAVVIPKASAARLELQNAMPARAGGYAELKLVDAAGCMTKIAAAGYRGLDTLADQAGELTGLEVRRLQEYMDD